MKVLVLTGSHRKDSNSCMLADKFIEGAKDAGHDVTRFDCGHKNVGACIGCDYCYTKGNGVCFQKDDFEEIRQTLIDADAVIFASPVYYFGLCAKLKAVIDRFYAIDPKLHQPKSTALLLSFADDETDGGTVNAPKMHIRVMADFLGWKFLGVVFADNVTAPGAAVHHPALQQAYELGKNLK